MQRTLKMVVSGAKSLLLHQSAGAFNFDKSGGVSRDMWRMPAGSGECGVAQTLCLLSQVRITTASRVACVYHSHLSASTQLVILVMHTM